MPINLKNIVLGLCLFGVASKCLVEGLQCYVCEDCNEYEDFKELHICGEIPVESTKEPVGLPEQLTESVSEIPLKESTLKPTTSADVFGSEVNQKPINESKPSETTSTASTTIESSTTESAPTTVAVSTTKAKPNAATDYDDYLEYEDPVARSLLKINEPVCYMVKYQVNNTVITNRGCTTFINANKYLTCQSLYNGAPMESCRVCSSNGCNKFLSDEGYDDDHGLPINAASVMGKFGFVVLLAVLINRFVI